MNSDFLVFTQVFFSIYTSIYKHPFIATVHLCVHSAFIRWSSMNRMYSCNQTHLDSGDSQWQWGCWTTYNGRALKLGGVWNRLEAKRGFKQTPLPTCLNTLKAYLSTQPSFLSAFMVRKSLKSLAEDSYMCSSENAIYISFFIQTTLSNNIKWY